MKFRERERERTPFFPGSQPNNKVQNPYHPPKIVTNQTIIKELITNRTLLSSNTRACNFEVSEINSKINSVENSQKLSFLLKKSKFINGVDRKNVRNDNRVNVVATQECKFFPFVKKTEMARF